MEDKRHCSPPGGRGSKLAPTATAIQSERERERRRIRARAREQINTVSSTPDRNAKCDEASGVPCKVPRFQYVDFPSLHQCIQQLSVPPLESWLSGCHMGMGITRPATGLTPTSPKERAPKFKYVDYPSLYHCIQQLSVPPLESWSATLPQPRGGGGGGSGARTVEGNPSESIFTREDQATQTPPSNRLDSACVLEERGGIRSSLSGDKAKERSSPEPNGPSNKQQLTDPARYKPSSTGSKTGKGSLGQGQGRGSSMMPDYYPVPATHPDPSRASPPQVSPKASRPSVISMHRRKETSLKRRLADTPPDSPQVGPSAPCSECVCTICQKMFAGPEELRNHQEEKH